MAQAGDTVIAMVREAARAQRRAARVRSNEENKDFQFSVDSKILCQKQQQPSDIPFKVVAPPSGAFDIHPTTIEIRQHGHAFSLPKDSLLNGLLGTSIKELEGVLTRAPSEDELISFGDLRIEQNQAIDTLQEAYSRGDSYAIVAYNAMILERSEYPEDFPHEFQVAHIAESKQLVVEYELPTKGVVPTVAEFKHIKSRNIIEGKPRKPAEVKALYEDIVAAIALRTMHEVFVDQGNHIEVVVFNGFVRTVDPATGKDISPHLVSVRATKEQFREIDLTRIDKRACLRSLGAQISPQPTEMLAVKPILDFNMLDKRFVEGESIVDNLDGRPNLMDLNPYEFEQLVCDLFTKQGLECKLTRASRDGGVDSIAFDRRPILGGKVVIQAKRYRHTVDVSAVRDLYGTMMNEGASKGILVTTSGYGPDAFEFAKNKPIELIGGGQLLHLLEEVGVKARIIMPPQEEDRPMRMIPR